MSTRAYPLPYPKSNKDPRFTFELLRDIGKLLEAAGYPPVTAGADIIELQLALFRFLYKAEVFSAEQGIPQDAAAVEKPEAPAPEIKHAMKPDGSSEPRCGAPGGSRIALFVDGVTCLPCRTALDAQLAEYIRTGFDDLTESTTTEPPGDAP